MRVNKKINSDFLNQMSGAVKIKNVTTKPCKIENELDLMFEKTKSVNKEKL